LGESRALDPAQKERFRRTGAAHLVAVSGLHLGLVVLAVFWAANRALLRVPPLARRIDVGRAAAAAAVPAAVFFALLAGGRTPVARACAMATCLLVARAAGRRGRTADALAFAGAALLAWDPGDLSTPGFQLSFSAVIAFALVLGRRPRGEKLLDAEGDAGARTALIRRAVRAAARALRATVVAAAATGPIALFHFGRISLLAIPVNALAVPFTSLALMPGLLAVSALAGPAPEAAAVLARPVGLGLGLLDRGLSLASELPCTVEPHGPLGACAATAACAAAIAAVTSRFRAAAAAGACAAILALSSAALDPTAMPAGRLTVDFLDVGQGDATLITFPNQRHWLVDSGGSRGGSFDPGARVVVPVLRALGVRRLDALVLTHPDPDHAGGMPAVADAVEVGEIWDNGQGLAEGAHESYGRLLALAERRAVPVLRGGRICGERRVGGVRVTALHPCHDPRGYDPGLDFNDNSIVLHLAFGSFSILLAGDLGAEGEGLLLARGAVPRADVLKLGHHGSRTSTTPDFLAAVDPSVAIASCGPWNPWGMPHRDVRAALRRRRVRLYRTDLDGAIRVVTDGEVALIEAARPAGRPRW